MAPRAMYSGQPVWQLASVCALDRGEAMASWTHSSSMISSGDVVAAPVASSQVRSRLSFALAAVSGSACKRLQNAAIDSPLGLLVAPAVSELGPAVTRPVGEGSGTSAWLGSAAGFGVAPGMIPAGAAIVGSALMGFGAGAGLGAAAGFGVATGISAVDFGGSPELGAAACGPPARRMAVDLGGDAGALAAGAGTGAGFGEAAGSGPPAGREAVGAEVAGGLVAAVFGAAAGAGAA